MRTTFEAADEEEAALIRAGLDDPATRALVKVVGALQKLPSDRAKRRVLWMVKDHLDEANATDAVS